MNSRHIASIVRPAQGLAALTCIAVVMPWARLDGFEDQVHPGRGSA